MSGSHDRKRRVELVEHPGKRVQLTRVGFDGRVTGPLLHDMDPRARAALTVANPTGLAFPPGSILATVEGEVDGTTIIDLVEIGDADYRVLATLPAAFDAGFVPCGPDRFLFAYNSDGLQWAMVSRRAGYSPFQ